MASNIVRHAWPQGGAGPIEVSISRRADAVVMHFEDGGVPFDPLTHPPAPTAVSLADARDGGLGLLLVRKVARDARYRREADRNLLTITIGPDWAS